MPETPQEIKFIIGFCSRLYLWLKERDRERKYIFLKFLLEGENVLAAFFL